MRHNIKLAREEQQNIEREQARLIEAQAAAKRQVNHVRATRRRAEALVRVRDDDPCVLRLDRAVRVAAV